MACKLHVAIFQHLLSFLSHMHDCALILDMGVAQIITGRWDELSKTHGQIKGVEINPHSLQPFFFFVSPFALSCFKFISSKFQAASHSVINLFLPIEFCVFLSRGDSNTSTLGERWAVIWLSEWGPVSGHRKKVVQIGSFDIRPSPL